MIRIFVLVGIVGGLLIAYLAVFAVGPISQLPPSESLLTGFRAKGIVPATINLEEDETAEEAEVFEVPEQDAVMLKQILANAGSMPGMKMNGKDDSAMKPDADMTNMPKTDGNMDMPKVEGNMDMPKAEGNMDMKGAEAKKMPMDGKMAEGGILVTDDGDFDREIKLTMAEWKFSAKQIEVKPGERIKFTVVNNGQIPHEFMFMNMPLMSAVTYRATRADWNLVEHKALFEKALVLPKGDFSFVLKVTQPGTWMFMCMLPYHMQMGMMGQMSTPGMAMDMNM